MFNAGRGVFARVAIKKGETIERCPVIEVSQHDFAELGESILVTYFYFFGKKKERCLMVLGFGSIYNHDDFPNATYTIKTTEKTIEFTSSRNIKKDEEITVNYTQGMQRIAPLWFE